MSQELFSVGDRVQGSGLLFRRTREYQTDVRTAKIRRKQHFRYGRWAHPRVRHFVADQLFQFFANAFRDTLGAMGVQPSE